MVEVFVGDEPHILRTWFDEPAAYRGFRSDRDVSLSLCAALPAGLFDSLDIHPTRLGSGDNKQLLCRRRLIPEKGTAGQSLPEWNHQETHRGRSPRIHECGSLGSPLIRA